ncbi:hypothetical protein RKLH11_2558 [Rhodobacteraceae bacterium KLH11]|nr:hypothetical protein RKLH11_2558 [Rhodobacteraceae bacterium KLH11]
MKYLKALGIYALAVPVFVWCWLREQRSAVYISHLNSFTEAHSMVRKLFNQNPET